MNPKIWTPRYLKNRIKLFAFEKFNKDKPWIAPKAIQWLDNNLSKEMNGVEFGSGRSTIWYANRLNTLVSIEDHEGWFKKVEKDLKSDGIENLNYIFKSSLDTDKGIIPYVDAINNFDDNSLDFVVVDGKHRDIIAKASIDKLKSGGYLLLDDAERYIPLETCSPYNYLREGKEQCREWKKFSNNTKGWEQLHFTSGVSDTVILIKP